MTNGVMRLFSPGVLAIEAAGAVTILGRVVNPLGGAI